MQRDPLCLADAHRSLEQTSNHVFCGSTLDCICCLAISWQEAFVIRSLRCFPSIDLLCCRPARFDCSPFDCSPFDFSHSTASRVTAPCSTAPCKGVEKNQSSKGLVQRNGFWRTLSQRISCNISQKCEPTTPPSKMPPQEKDQYLGGWIGAAFFLVGAPAAILMGYKCHSANRCTLFFWVVILGGFTGHARLCPELWIQRGAVITAPTWITSSRGTTAARLRRSADAHSLLAAQPGRMSRSPLRCASAAWSHEHLVIRVWGPPTALLLALRPIGVAIAGIEGHARWLKPPEPLALLQAGRRACRSCFHHRLVAAAGAVKTTLQHLSFCVVFSIRPEPASCAPDVTCGHAGEAPCVLTYFVTKYWELLILRLLTGISLGGIFPLVRTRNIRHVRNPFSPGRRNRANNRTSTKAFVSCRTLQP